MKRTNHLTLQQKLMLGCSALLVGVLVDGFGSFTPVLLTVLATMVCSFGACMALQRKQQ